MKGAVLLVLAFAVCAMAIIQTPKTSTLDQAVQFEEFKLKYGKEYASAAENSMRFTHFKNSLKRVELLNWKHGEPVYGVTKFSDLSPEEFRAMYLNANIKRTKPEDKQVIKLHEEDYDIPAEFDWRDHGAVTAVKDQGQCGSCWAFSVTEEVESTWILAGKGTNTTTILAPQQIVDCDTVDQGCNGGDTPTAYAYIEKAGGLELETSYPYKAEDGTCKFDKSKVVASISGFKYATRSTQNPEAEQQMQAALASTAPMSICVDASTWQDYSGGIITSGCGTSIDHCVQAVGYAQNPKDTSSSYWIIRNSWNTDWGEKGFIYVEIGKDLCGVTSEATITTV
jgi:cathepsin F